MPKVRKARKNRSHRVTPDAISIGAGGGSARGPQGQGFTFNHALGQHILKNPLIVNTIVEKSKIRATDTVLEIGPGTGNLTVQLLRCAAKVIAVEFDPRMVAELSKRTRVMPEGKKLQIIHGDVMKVDLPYFDVCVANIPYQISSPLTFKLLAHEPPFRHALLMYQREFAMRLVANPGSALFCRLSLNTQLLSKASHVLKVSKNNFRPPPKVESSVVRLEPRIPRPSVDFKEWDGLVRICFQRKNKSLRAIFTANSVVQLLEKNYRTHCALTNTPLSMEPTKDRIIQVLSVNDYGGKRAAKLEENDFLELLSMFNKAGFHFTS